MYGRARTAERRRRAGGGMVSVGWRREWGWRPRRQGSMKQEWKPGGETGATRMGATGARREKRGLKLKRSDAANAV
ncbi:hypothetical protein HETIRDRAFT_410065 [Heterobasidion irregulare TC 32-1]|uniref:Uncharacterized protein n=1 Tax=Heterobasidion irregulare (strain TC 32-1) TaxID=747525 RepID=W4K4Z6_HETIT|nr:uncharacterized protein HETIRDRAFT_410065 [Heterobasidion irregulare TC 32-1]ETW80809.1 hypothetical protein HETIRDRAFT_410065 [Heterobasidion irregulare TC 32-1]